MLLERVDNPDRMIVYLTLDQAVRVEVTDFELRCADRPELLLQERVAQLVWSKMPGHE